MELDTINDNSVDTVELNPTKSVELEDMLRRLYRERKWRLTSLTFGLALWFGLHAITIYYPTFAGDLQIFKNNKQSKFAI